MATQLLDFEHVAVEDAIARDLPFRAWPVPLRLAAAGEAARRGGGELLAHSLLGAAISALAVLIDVANGIGTEGLRLRGLIVMPAFLLAAALAHIIPPRWRMSAYALPMAAFAASSVLLGNFAAPTIAEGYVSGAALSVGVIALFLPLRTLDLLCAEAISCAAMLIAYLSHHPLSELRAPGLTIFMVIACFALSPLAARINRFKDRNFLLALRTRLAQEELLAANDALRKMSECDALTGLANRRSFERIFDESFNASLDAGLPVAVLMIDIDRFKWFNDDYGHQAGDECIRAVAQVIGREAEAAGSIAARYGGEEFIVVAPSAAGGAALHLSERIRARVSELAIAVKHDEAATVSVGVTVSIGVAVGAPRTVRRKDLIEHADQALYAAKHAGRNRVAMHARPAAADRVAKTPRLGDLRGAGGNA